MTFMHFLVLGLLPQGWKICKVSCYLSLLSMFGYSRTHSLHLWFTCSISFFLLTFQSCNPFATHLKHSWKGFMHNLLYTGMAIKYIPKWHAHLLHVNLKHTFLMQHRVYYIKLTVAIFKGNFMLNLSFADNCFAW